MATTDSNGIVFLEETDPISPIHTTINVLQQGTSDVVTAIKDGSSDILVIHKVADTTERAALVTAYGPTSTNPLYVERADANPWYSVERTEDGTNWTVFPSSIPPTAYTPTFSTTGGAINVGSGGLIRSRYARHGSVVHYWGRITIGTSSSFTAGTLQVSLPITGFVNTDDQFIIGSVWLLDASPNTTNHAFATVPDGSPATFQIRAPGVTGAVTNTTPWTWTNGDQIRWDLTYEAA